MLPETHANIHTCLNCGNQFEGKVCNTCGQKTKHFNVTPKGLFLEWWSVRKEDLRHFWFTTKSLILSPGMVLDEYLDGKRKKYYNSTNYFLLIASIVTIITIQFRDLNPEEALANVSSFYESIGFPVDESNKGGIIAMEWISRHYNVALMMTLPFLALGSFLSFKWFFKIKKRKLGEHFVMHLFVYGLQNFLLIPTLPFINPSSPESKAMFITSSFMILLYAWVYKDWFKLNWAKAILASILAYALYFAAFILGIITVVVVAIILTVLTIMIVKLF